MENDQIEELAARVSKAYRDRDYNLGLFLVKVLNKQDKEKVISEANRINMEIRLSNPR